MKIAAAIAFGITLSLAAIAYLSSSSSEAATHQPPPHMLWAWERPEDLRFIDPAHTGVAYLSNTVNVQRGRVTMHKRHQPLLVAPNSYLMAVIRIESDGTLTALNDGVIDQILNDLPNILKPGIRAVQFDFDARKSEREWYAKLLYEVRKKLPGDCFLSITSLASWCLGDDWLSSMHLPVDEVVPMFFDMGADTQSIKTRIETGQTLGHKFKSIGIRNDELSINSLLSKAGQSVFEPNPRVYLFSHRSWNPDKAQKIVQEVERWR